MCVQVKMTLFTRFLQIENRDPQPYNFIALTVSGMVRERANTLSS